MKMNNVDIDLTDYIKKLEEQNYELKRGADKFYRFYSLVIDNIIYKLDNIANSLKPKYNDQKEVEYTAWLGGAFYIKRKKIINDFSFPCSIIKNDLKVMCKEISEDVCKLNDIKEKLYKSIIDKEIKIEYADEFMKNSLKIIAYPDNSKPEILKDIFYKEIGYKFNYNTSKYEEDLIKQAGE